MSGNLTHVLFENASGYALFEVTMQEEIVSPAHSFHFIGSDRGMLISRTVNVGRQE